MSPQTAIDLIRSRRTIHSFKPETPPREIIVRGVDAARWAPNHRLTEPWRFYLPGPQTIEAICQLNATLVSQTKGIPAGQAKLKRWREIPGWLVVSCKLSNDAIRSREDYAACCCVVQNLMLYLWSIGIGSKWNTGNVTRDPAFFEILSIDPELETIVSLMWYGYPQDVPKTERKPVAEVLSELP